MERLLVLKKKVPLFSGAALAGERPELSRRVAAGPLDLYDVGAEVREELGRIWPAMYSVRSRTVIPWRGPGTACISAGGVGPDRAW
jgi:hypothetical protein